MYLLLQSAALTAFWLWLAADPASIERFIPPTTPRHVFGVFAAPDLALYAAASTLTAIGLIRRSAWTPAAACAHAGAAGYAGLYAIGLSLADPSLWLSGVLMAPAVVVPPIIAVFAWRERSA